MIQAESLSDFRPVLNNNNLFISGGKLNLRTFDIIRKINYIFRKLKSGG